MNNNSDRTASNLSGFYLNGTHRSFGPAGCLALSEGRKCGETKTLQIIQEFKNLYEKKMKQIDAEAGGDCVQAKINLQQDWIRDLTEQNDMLVRVVEELELEAADRVMMLEDKLQQSAKCACEVMESYKDFSITLVEDFQKMDQMQSDVHNLLELIRRARQDGEWNYQDLKFYGFKLDEILDERSNALRREKILKEKDKTIQDLKEKIEKLHEDGFGVEETVQARTITQQYGELKKSMMDMREALTAEVANKHDMILSLRRDVMILEEQCRKADQQTHFKDDIIKELRKEIKQLKQQDKEDLLTLEKLYEENLKLHKEVKTLQVKLGDIKREVTIRIVETGVKVVQTTPSVGEQCITDQPCYLEEIRDIMEGVEREKMLVVDVDQEVRSLVADMYKKDKQLLDQNDLIVILKTCPNCQTLKKQVDDLEILNQDLQKNVCHAKGDLQDFEGRAQQYAKERDSYKLKHQESLDIIETLQKENKVGRERLKVLQEERDNSIDNFQSALISELDGYEKKHRESVQKIESMRSELEKAKSGHKDSMDQILCLNDENRSQNCRIESLQVELKEKSRKPVTHDACTCISISSKTIGCDTSDSQIMKDKAINSVPEMRYTCTCTDDLESAKTDTAVASTNIHNRDRSPQNRECTCSTGICCIHHQEADVRPSSRECSCSTGICCIHRQELDVPHSTQECSCSAGICCIHHQDAKVYTSGKECTCSAGIGCDSQQEKRTKVQVGECYCSTGICCIHHQEKHTNANIYTSTRECSCSTEICPLPRQESYAKANVRIQTCDENHQHVDRSKCMQIRDTPPLRYFDSQGPSKTDAYVQTFPGKKRESDWKFGTPYATSTAILHRSFDKAVAFTQTSSSRGEEAEWECEGPCSGLPGVSPELYIASQVDGYAKIHSGNIGDEILAHATGNYVEVQGLQSTCAKQRPKPLPKRNHVGEKYIGVYAGDEAPAQASGRYAEFEATCITPRSDSSSKRSHGKEKYVNAYPGNIGDEILAEASGRYVEIETVQSPRASSDSSSKRIRGRETYVDIYSRNDENEIAAGNYLEVQGIPSPKNSRKKDKSSARSFFNSLLECPKRKVDTTPGADFDVEPLPKTNKADAINILDTMGSQLLDVVEIDAYSRVMLPSKLQGDLVGTSSTEDIQQIVQIEILNRVTSDSSDKVASCVADSYDESPRFSPKYPVTFANDVFNTAFSFDESSSRSPTSTRSSFDSNTNKSIARTPVSTESSAPSRCSTRTHLARTCREPDMEKPATPSGTTETSTCFASKLRPKAVVRQRDRASATDDLQTVVNDLNESVSRIIMKSPCEKASRERIAQLEEQLRVVNSQLKLIRNKDEMIKVQNDTLNIVQIELQALKQKERDVEAERGRRGQEVENLKLTIKEMEKALNNSQEKAQNLQKAVDLNVNTLNVLEASEERWKTEVAQQRTTINNLQEALVVTKHHLDELQQRNVQDAEEKYAIINILEMSLQELEKEYVHYYSQFLNASATVEFLRDFSLDLEVEKFDLVQDLSVLESRLLKYQKIFRIKEETEGNTLEQENTALTSMVSELEAFTQSLQGQIDMIEAALIREKKINNVASDRIEELQGIIGAKNIDINRYNDAYLDVKSKFDAAVSKNKTLEDSIRELQEHVNSTEMNQTFREETNDICHGELDMCLDNLQQVKFKMRSQYETLNQKIQEYTALQADFKVQSNNAEIYKRDLENTRIRYRDEVIELKRNIRDLKEKLKISENKIEITNEELKQSQAMLIESAQRETKIQQDFSAREQELSEKIHSTHSEEMRLLDLVTQLEQQLANMRNELVVRDQQLEIAKVNVVKARTEGKTQVNMAQEEINALKNELNGMVQKQAKLKMENEKLQEQLSRLKNSMHLFEQRNNVTKQRLDQAMSDIQALQADKQYLEQKNEQMSCELKCLQGVLQNKTESVVNLETELLEAKANQEELCVESRNVVSNVRAWLEEQKMVNQQLKEKLQKKNAIIAKFQKEKQLAESCGGACPAKPRQRGGSLGQQYFPANSPPPAYNAPWNLGSHGSGSESPGSSGQEDWYDYGEESLEDDHEILQEKSGSIRAFFKDAEYSTMSIDTNPQMWIHRVESMTQELQRSNRYWKKKINETEFMVTKDE